MSWSEFVVKRILGTDSIDQDEVSRALALLTDPSYAYEVRGINPTGHAHGTVCRTLEEGLAAVLDHTGFRGIYLCLNPIKPDAKSASKSTVVSRRWMLVDIDPIRPKDTSATEDEKAAGVLVVSHVIDYLTPFGWPAPVISDSGNGWHLLYRLELPNNELSRQIVRSAIHRLADLCDSAEAKIDRATHDAPRISKIPGTWARKGPDTPDRPHRQAALVSVPGTIEVVSIELLKALGTPEPKQNGQALSTSPWEVHVTAETQGLASYCQRAIEAECGKLACSPEGSRNAALNSAAFSLGTMASWPEMSQQAAQDALRGVASRIGLDAREIALTIASGWNAGAAQPRARPAPNVPLTQHAQEKPIAHKNGEVFSCLHNARLWLEEPSHGCLVRYDSFRQVVLLNAEPLTDEAVIHITAKMEAATLTTWTQEHVRSALIDIAFRHQFSSVVEWLDSLQWDGLPRINQFFTTGYGSEAGEYSQACGRVLCLSAVARAYEPGCQEDVMVVMIGKQGLGKSVGIASLCPRPEWFADDLGCDLFDRKAGEGLRGKWLIEFSEFSRINRATLDVVKSFVTRRSDYYRPAYGRTHKDYPRSCVFVGTTNEDHPLRDAENRRFMPIVCTQADLGWISRNRDQIWAEAVDRYRHGEQWWITDPTLIQEVMNRQETANLGDCWEEILDKAIGHRTAITMDEAASELRITPDRIDRSVQTRIGNNLKALGFVRTRIRTANGLSYTWKKP